METEEVGDKSSERRGVWSAKGFSVLSRATGHARRLWVYRDMVYNLIRKDFRVRYQGAALGFAWSLGNPLALIVLYDVIFTHVFRSNIKDYVLYLFIGVVSYNLFSQAVLQGCESLTGAASFLQKIYFPRILVPTANVLFSLVLSFAAFLVLFAVFPLIGGVYHWDMLLYPLALGLFIIFSWGIALVFSVLHVEFRDLKHLIEILLMFLFWVTPITFDASMIHSHIFLDILALNPLTYFFTAFHDLLYSGRIPSLSTWALMAVFAAITATAGVSLFRVKAAQLIELL